MKFCIFGAGGTGGVLAAYLSLAGHDVTLIARGKHLAAIRENGLTLHTNHRGTEIIRNLQVCTAAEYEDVPDVCFVCVKYYNLADAISFVREKMGKGTLIIPVLNVFGTGGVMQEQLPELTCLDGCIYVMGEIEAPGVIYQSDKMLRVIYGYRPGQRQDLLTMARDLEKVLQAAEIRGHFSDNIVRDALQKFAYVSPAGAAGAYFNVTSEKLQQNGPEREMFTGLIKEVVALGKAMGIEFEKDLVETGLKIMDALKPGSTTSMQRDILRGRQSEFAGLVTRVVELGETYHVPVPLYQKINDWGKENLQLHG
ncbi:putative 2-dehydropantoate 2-reductase [Selenomonas ruminantium subsp. lactilytica TAM6421]|uniref:2-dehydropantoate 2-reductase n=1 Tax=Selenomonas ruminantium subsp. lactilytica (strain NBRC 103574 / TAM6421) TaxID=927704 RepID=I0GSZ0_SELRL|nr:2-dehydropantoate 2-reductase [Selenomonas ruminantium]BAL83877.1 putative 2-dehydropantoate 2-reductase [Selenomonas ruminantium subsp. lactilytica TAM6421]